MLEMRNFQTQYYPHFLVEVESASHSQPEMQAALSPTAPQLLKYKKKHFLKKCLCIWRRGFIYRAVIAVKPIKGRNI